MVHEEIPKNSHQQMLRTSFSQNGGVVRKTSLLHTTKGRITTNLKTKNNQNFWKIKLHGTPTTKKLKKHSSRLVGGAEMDSRQRGCPAR